MTFLKKIISKISFSWDAESTLSLCAFIFFVSWFIYLKVGYVFWFDEAHSLLLVINNTSFIDFVHAMQYEGTPFLWHFLLWGINRIIGITPEIAISLHFIFLFVFLFVVFFLIRIPFLFRLLLVLQDPVFFYAIQIRQYQISSTLMLLLAYVWQKKNDIQNKWSYIILALLTQTSVHAAIVAGGFFIFLVIDNFHRKKRIFCKYQLITIFGFLLTTIQLIPAPDLTYAFSKWDFTIGMHEFMILGGNIIHNVFLSQYTLLTLIISVYFFGIILIVFKQNFHKMLFSTWPSLLTLLFIYSIFLIIEGFKYPFYARHHWMLFYALIVFLMYFASQNYKKMKLSIGICIVFFPFLIVSIINFCHNSLIYKIFETSQSKNVAQFLDTYYNDNYILVKPEIFSEPILLYTEKIQSFYSIDRQKFYKYVIYNHDNVDHVKNKNDASYLDPNTLKKNILATPQNIRDSYPIVVLARLTGGEAWNSFESKSHMDIPIDDVYFLQYLEKFNFSSAENYQLYRLMKK